MIILDNGKVLSEDMEAAFKKIYHAVSGQLLVATDRSYIVSVDTKGNISAEQACDALAKWNMTDVILCDLITLKSAIVFGMLQLKENDPILVLHEDDVKPGKELTEALKALKRQNDMNVKALSFKREDLFDDTGKFIYANTMDMTMQRELLASYAIYIANDYMLMAKQLRYMLTNADEKNNKMDFSKAMKLFSSISLGMLEVPNFTYKEGECEQWKKDVLETNALTLHDICDGEDVPDEIRDMRKYLNDVYDLMTLYNTKAPTTGIVIKCYYGDLSKKNTMPERFEAYDQAICISPLINSYVNGVPINDILA